MIAVKRPVGEVDGHAVEGADLGLAPAVDLDGVDDAGGGARCGCDGRRRVRRSRCRRGVGSGGGHRVDLLCRRWCVMAQRSALPAPDVVGSRAVRDRPADVRLGDDARVVRRADAPARTDSVRSSGELVRAPTRAPAVVQPARGRRRARRCASSSSASSTVFGQDIRDDSGVITTASGTRRLAVVDRARGLRPDRDPPSRCRCWRSSSPAIGILVHILIGWPEGALPTRRAVPHLHGRRVVPAADGARRARGRRGRHRRCSGSPTHPASTRSACSAISPSSSPRWAIGVALRNRREAHRRPGCARPRSAPRPSARARRACSPRSGCASPRSCTTWSPTRCR